MKQWFSERQQTPSVVFLFSRSDALTNHRPSIRQMLTVQTASEREFQSLIFINLRVSNRTRTHTHRRLTNEKKSFRKKTWHSQSTAWQRTSPAFPLFTTFEGESSLDDIRIIIKAPLATTRSAFKVYASILSSCMFVCLFDRLSPKCVHRNAIFSKTK